MQQGDEVFIPILSVFASLILSSACIGCSVNSVRLKRYPVCDDAVLAAELCSFVIAAMTDV